jgi:hypothetical protein
MGGVFSSRKAPEQEPIVAPPPAPAPASTIATVEPETGTLVTQKRKPIPKSRTIYHQTLGQTDTAQVASKTLLGQ